LDSPDIRRILPIVSPGVVTDDSYILFLEDGLVRAQKLDMQSWEPEGPVFTLGEGAYQEGLPNVYSEAMSLSVGGNGSLAFRQGKANRRRLTWFGRAGASLGGVGAEGSYESPVLSPDDSRVAFGRDGQIWVIDLARGGAEYPLTSGATRAMYPIWSPDGRSIVYPSGPEGSMVLHRKPSNGTGEAEALQGMGSPFSWSAGYVTYFTTHPDTSDDIYVLPIDGDGGPRPFLRTEAIEHESSLSADGKRMAYVTEESGQAEVYVETFPRSGERWRISPSGGCQPIWRRDGRELFFLALDGTLMAVPIQTRPRFEAGDPEPLFQTHAQVWAARNSYSPTRDGQRFLVNVDPEIAVWKTAVVLNWREALADL
jgi:dipeptidyl aminopeptidase/acylaminoacyl peptidase